MEGDLSEKSTGSSRNGPVNDEPHPQSAQLLEATRAVLGIIHPHVLAQRASNELHNLLGCEFTSLALRERRDLLVMRGAYGARTRYVGLEVPVGHGIGGKILMTGEPVSVYNYLDDSRISSDFLQVALDEGLYSMTGVPIFYRHELVGVLYAGGRRPMRLSQADRECLEEFAGSLGPLVYAASSVKATQDMSVHEERIRIARQLHDSVGQLLYTVGISLDRVHRDTPASAEALREEVGMARGQVATAAEQLRGVFRALAPSSSEEELALLMHMDADEFEHRSGTPIHFCVVGEARRLPSEVEAILLRAEREGLRNVERHAGASSVILTLHYGEDQAGVVVQDDGHGPREARIRHLPIGRSGWGLSAIRNDVERMGGGVDLLGDESGGVLRVSVPVEPAPRRIGDWRSRREPPSEAP